MMANSPESALSIRGDLITPDTEIKDGILRIRNGVIEEVTKPSGELTNGKLLDFRGKKVIPGLIDTHIHGAGGFDMTGKGVADAAGFLPSHGVTSFLATTHFMLGRKNLLQAVVEIADAMQSPPQGATILGIHMEGPWVAADRSPFSKPEYCYPITREDILAFQQAAHHNLRMVTFAPELAGAMEVVPFLRELGIIPSIGHTNASYEEVKTAVGQGLNHSTHTFNAMQPLHHRKPGTLGAILDFDEITAEMIGDGFHVQAPLMRLLLKVKGVERVCLVSDGVPLSGLPAGTRQDWYGFDIGTNGEISTLPDGRPAGAYKLLDQQIQVLIREEVTDLPTAVTIASRIPAAMLGLKKGQLRSGYDADVVVLSEEYQPILSMVAGRVVFQRETQSSG
jgi:N-acetylglucosamine-6-phosphate deacetylase